MLFSFAVFNHCGVGLQSLDDLIGIVGSQLQDLGHETCRNEQGVYAPPAVNLVFENFDARTLPALKDGVNKGARFVMIATERANEKGLYSSAYPEWIAERTMHFEKAAKFVDAIWVLQPDAMDWYKKFHDKVDLIELGYSDRLLRGDTPYEGGSDFSFFGGMTPYRKDLIHRLAERAPVFIPPPGQRGLNYLPPAIRNDMVWKSKVVLHLKQQEDWPIISACRCATALHLGRPVFSEPVDCNEPWKEVVRFASSLENFVDEALWVLDNWQNEYTVQMENFRKLTAERCLGEAVQKTVERMQ